MVVTLCVFVYEYVISNNDKLYSTAKKFRYRYSDVFRKNIINFRCEYNLVLLRLKERELSCIIYGVPFCLVFDSKVIAIFLLGITSISNLTFTWDV